MDYVGYQGRIEALGSSKISDGAALTVANCAFVLYVKDQTAINHLLRITNGVRNGCPDKVHRKP